ncbi:MHC class II antigen beta chain [Aix galericulata]|nr:MHC class II antigen beta chain [Aix galericulata]
MGSGRILGAGAVLVALVVLGARPAAGEETKGFFQFLGTAECHYLNGTERVRFLDTYIYNRQQFVHYDSDLGHFVADTELGKPDADYWNSQPEILEDERGAVDRFCRHNYNVYENFILNRKVEPKVRVSPMQSSSLPQTDRLACYVTGFYPAEIEVKWFKNGQEETKHVVSTDVIQNGDWTYQVLVMLESTPQHGDTYKCHVQHASLKSPITYEWGVPVLRGAFQHHQHLVGPVPVLDHVRGHHVLRLLLAVLEPLHLDLGGVEARHVARQPVGLGQRARLHGRDPHLGLNCGERERAGRGRPEPSAHLQRCPRHRAARGWMRCPPGMCLAPRVQRTPSPSSPGLVSTHLSCSG